MAPKKQIEANELMIVNDSPGEECRIAILQDKHLEELYTERVISATNVGNIYKGRVVNVEPAIQAAFIDYGEGINGFLHISDLHPKYFPGEERTERVGKKIPRRDRPPIQEALRRGQEILVQVLKEGLGTKGPTLTSYLSIPGRLLVLMPDMDRVGVSRKVEDEEKRREMRQILDSLNLPDGFGFILRTAGFGETKTELKRDAAYLMRLWKVMDKRIKKVGAPCELYTESDLLIRTVRDILRPSIKAIIVDSESAFERVSGFLGVVAPRSAPRVLRYRKSAPIFHAFDIERQIDLIHSREVPLASGGRLVIDQTEAVVAIDVNSGRSRSARDSETNAYETNLQAADEICRQLRLRDLGGLIINDLIDMHSPKHRKAIEERFALNLKRDRAKSTALRISDFGILEMTRQRMRPSIRKSHFMACSHCNGRGEIKVPEHVAADAVRHIGFLLQYDRVKRVEMVCSSRVASVLLSAKRRDIVRMEDEYGKRVDVRVSDAIAVDRADFYAYDDRNADIDIAHLPALQPPSLEDLQVAQLLPEVEETVEAEVEEDEGRPGLRRRGRHGPADATAIAMAGGFEEELRELEELDDAEAAARLGATPPMAAQARSADGQLMEAGGRRRRRRRRRRGGGGEPPAVPHALPHPDGPFPAMITPAVVRPAVATAAPNGQPGQTESGSRSSRRRRRRRKRFGEQPAAGATPAISPIAINEVSAPTEDLPAESIAASRQSTAFEQDQSQDLHNLRVHELAKELNVTSHEVIERCEPDQVLHHVTTAMSSVSPEEASTIREMFAHEEHDAGQQGASDAAAPGEASTVDGPAPASAAVGPQRKRRRRGRRQRGPAESIRNQAAAVTSVMVFPEQSLSPDAAMTATVQPGAGTGGARRSRRRRRGRRGREQFAGQSAPGANLPSSPPTAAEFTMNQPRPQPQGHEAETAAPHTAASTVPATPNSSQSRPVKKKRRALYRAGRGSVSPVARQTSSDDSE